MERDQHRCKVCCKSFPSGRSLGGHMRSHVASNSIGADEKLPKLGTGYGLRENPKKTWRLSDSDADPRQKRCRDCGKEFQSWRALFGHMRCHSQKKKNGTLWEEEQEKEEEEIVEEGSWSQSDNAGMALVVPKRKRRSRRSAAAAASSSSVSEYDREQEDVAISLMMLSRDDWGGFNPMAESSDKNSVVLEDDMGFAEEVSGVKLGVWGIGYGKNGLNRANSDASDEFKKPTIQFFDAGSYVTEFSVEESGKGSKCLLNCASDELGKEVGFSLEVGKFDPAKMGELVAYGFKPESDHIAVFGRSGRRSRFECTTCNKAFQSYQALGGHRASHKRMFKSCLSPGIDGSLETDTSLDQSAAMTGLIDGELGIEFDYGSSSASKKLKGHECLICGKVFSSGQALGGHKRCHLVVGSDQTIVIGQQEELAMSNLLDLNLPAPVDDGKWWIGSSLEQDQPLIGIISN